MEDKSVLILGSPLCDHVKAVAGTIESEGVGCFILDTETFPQQTTIIYNPEKPCLIDAQGNSISFAGVRSVYWRTYSGVNPHLLGNSQVDSLSVQDCYSLLESALNEAGPVWYNSYDAWRMHKNKPLQLKHVSRLGVRIPKTLITNDMEAAQKFYQMCPDMIYKPVFGGAETERVTPNLMTNDHLSKVFSSSPVTLQEYIAGTNIRTYVIDDAVWSAEIKSDNVDFRTDMEHEIQAVDTPPDVKRMSLQICKVLELSWTAIDWRRTQNDEYFFLEANPSPMFIGFSLRSGISIQKYLVNALLKK